MEVDTLAHSAMEGGDDMLSPAIQIFRVDVVQNRATRKTRSRTSSTGKKGVHRISTGINRRLRSVVGGKTSIQWEHLLALDEQVHTPSKHNIESRLAILLRMDANLSAGDVVQSAHSVDVKGMMLRAITSIRLNDTSSIQKYQGKTDHRPRTLVIE